MFSFGEYQIHIAEEIFFPRFLKLFCKFIFLVYSYMVCGAVSSLNVLFVGIYSTSLSSRTKYPN